MIAQQVDRFLQANKQRSYGVRHDLSTGNRFENVIAVSFEDAVDHFCELWSITSGTIEAVDNVSGERSTFRISINLEQIS